MPVPKVGTIVRVALYLVDGAAAAQQYRGQQGTVVYHDYDCGCGQSEGDPMIGVLFDDGKIEEFWREELWLVQRVQH